MLISYHCRHFQGPPPGGFHKAAGAHCKGYPYYDSVSGRINTCTYYFARADDQERMLDLPAPERFEAVS